MKRQGGKKPPPGGNPFDLAKREAVHGGRARTKLQHVAREYSEDEVQTLLEGFYTVTPEHWDSLAPGTLVRYISKVDGFHWGGWVRGAGVPITTGVPPQMKIHLILQFPQAPRPGAAARRWFVPYEDIEKIWARADAAMATVMGALTHITAQLNARLDQLDRRLKALER